MIKVMPYEDISQTMYYLMIQVKESISFADEWLPPGIKDPRKLFNLLRMHTIYKKDTPGIEQLQTMQTLLGKNNIHGIPGAGDCDCFTIMVSACCKVMNLKTEIVLAGRSKKDPVHIYNIVDNEPFDLTCTFYGMKRFYPYEQLIPIVK